MSYTVCVINSYHDLAGAQTRVYHLRKLGHMTALQAAVEIEQEIFEAEVRLGVREDFTHA